MKPLSAARYIFGATFAAMVLVASVPASAQKPADLTGKWTFVKAKSTAVPTVPRIFNTTGAPAGSDALTITQTPAMVTVKVGEVTLNYHVDGTAANISAEGRAGFPVGKGAWNGGKLVVSLTQEVFAPAKGDYVKVPLEETYSVENGELVIQRTRTHVSGKTDTEKLVYAKAGS